LSCFPESQATGWEWPPSSWGHTLILLTKLYVWLIYSRRNLPDQPTVASQTQETRRIFHGRVIGKTGRSRYFN
jgi:hypothetical protein